jgi:hypothetical protein
MSLKDQILQAKFGTKQVLLPELPGTAEVYVRMLPANRRLEIVKLAEADDGLERLAILASVDADGAPVFADEDKDALGAVPLVVLNRIAEAFFDFNGWSENGRAELGKASATIQATTSPTLSAVS